MILGELATEILVCALGNPIERCGGVAVELYDELRAGIGRLAEDLRAGVGDNPGHLNCGAAAERDPFPPRRAGGPRRTC